MSESAISRKEKEESRIYRLRWWSLLVIAVSTMVMSLNTGIMNVALPTIQSELNATITELQWVVNIYMMIVGALLLTCGSLSDRLGRAIIFLTGIAVFGLANIGAVFSTNATHLIVSRAFMGVGAAMMQSCTLAIIVNLFPRDEHGKAIGVWGGIMGAGLALGSLIGGGILETLSWRWIFIFNILAAGAALTLGCFLVPNSKDDRPRRLDFFGNVLFLALIASLIFGLNNAGSRGWTDSVVLSAILGSALALALFVLWERRIPEPLLEMSFFNNSSFNTSLIAISILLFYNVGMQYLLTFYMQFVKDLTPLQTGVRYLPLAAGGLIGSMLSDRLVTRLGMKRVMSWGFVGGALILLYLAFLKITTPFSQFGPALFILGFVNGCTVAPVRTMLMRSVPIAKAGIGSAMNNVATYVMGSIAVATLGSILSSIYSYRFLNAAHSIQGIPSGLLDKASDSVGAAVKISRIGQIPPDTVDIFVTAARHSFMDGWQVVIIILCVVCVVGATVCQWIMPGRSGVEETR